MNLNNPSGVNVIVFAGCGALGSFIASHLNVPETIEYVLIDDDVVEEQNIGTSIYEKVMVGIPKVQALGTLLYRRNRRRCRVSKRTIENYIDLRCAAGGHYDDDLVIDTFDNPVARNTTRGNSYNVLHCGVSPDFTGSILWDEIYPELDISFERGENLVCTNQLGASIIRLTAIKSCDIIETYLATGEKLNTGVTLK